MEITSPTTKDYDYGTKRGYYFGLPALRHYVLVSQRERLVAHYRRVGEEWIYVDRGPDAAIEMESVTIQISSIYDGILD